MIKSVLDLCDGFPTRRVSAGELLIRQGKRKTKLYVLRRGSFEVQLGGESFLTITTPGAFLGEISTLLGTAPTATVIASEDSDVYVIENAAVEILQRPELVLSISQVLARRLTAMTRYLAEMKEQHTGDPAQLAVMDQALSRLLVAPSQPEKGD